MRTKILLDTDIGGDIDDAICLAYLLAQPNCDLVGITTVHGDTEQRAMVASALCKVAGQQIPIFPGAQTPLLGGRPSGGVAAMVALEKWAHDYTFPRGQAIDFMRHTIRANPGEIILLAIGPLTNVALLFALDPDITSLLKGLVMMCGVFTNRLPGTGPLSPREWNALVDPHATALVYRADVAIHRSVGLDVTMQVQMDSQMFRERFQHDRLRPVIDFAEIWFQEVPGIIFHDPLAATTIFDNQICRFESGLVEVELASERLQGLTYWTPGRTLSHHEVALRVDPVRFFTHYFSLFEP